ncbi:MAG: N-acetylmuramoyl-L-alanine amidase [Spirosomaceae bacterium]|nr:N-acetylmuramoyl-L-alanine amidase [Spirosomataceae bacterium]
MKKWFIGWLCLVLVFSGLASFTVRAYSPLNTIVIDAGHGGKDPGTGNGKEKHIALNIALRLGKLIKDEMPEVNVIYTRTKDVFIPLNERSDIANKNNADLFISIHCNASPSSKSAHGTETYVMGLHKTEANLELAKKENSVVLLEDDYKKTYKGFDPNSALAHIMLTNYQSAFMHQSLQFASVVEDKMATVAGRRSRGVKQAGFLVIWQTTMPSVLIETGFLTNNDDLKHLSTETGRQDIALAIYDALKIYKQQLGGN